MSTNTTESKLPTHKNLQDRIAALQRLNQQSGSPSTSPNPSATSSSPDPSLPTTHSNINGNNNAKRSLRDKIAKFEAAGGTPIPRGSFGMGPMPYHEDDVSRRKGEMLGNRVPGLNRPAALPTEGLGMTSKSHLTVKPIAKDSANRHNRGESQSLGSNHRRFTSYSNLTSPTLSAYDGEGGAGLSEVDEFGGLNWLDRPQTPFSLYSPTLTPQSLPSPELTATDKLPGKVAIPDKFQRRVVSDFQASYGIARAFTPDPDMPLEQLEEDVPLSSPNCGSPRLEAESILDSKTDVHPKEPEVKPPTELTLEFQPSTEPIPDVQTSTSDAYLPPPTDSFQEVTAEAVLNPASEPILVVDVFEEDAADISQQTIDANAYTQPQDHGPIPEVSNPNPISTPSTAVMDIADASPASPRNSTFHTPRPPAEPFPAARRDEQFVLQPPEEFVPSPNAVRESQKAPAPPTFAFQPSPSNSSPTESPPAELQTPPESPRPASSTSTSTSDLSDLRINYQSGSDPDDDLFVLPLPKDDELPPRSIVKEVAVPRPIHRAFAPPPSTLQPPIDFPVMATKSVPSTPSDLDISLTADESLALDASQAEIVIAQSEVISPASPTLVVAMRSPSPSTTAFRMRTPPLPEETLPPADEGDDTQVSPPRIRKKLYTNHTVPTSFKDTLVPPPTRRSFSAVVHQKNRSQTSIPDRVDSATPKPSQLANLSMTPKKKQGLFAEPMTPASPGSDLAFLAQHAAILEAHLSRVGDFGDEGLNRPGPSEPSIPEPPRSMLRPEISKVRSASTPTLVPSSVTTPGHIPPVPDLVYDDGSSNSMLSSAPRIPPFLPQFRSRKSGPHEEVDRKSLAPSYKSRRSDKSAKEKDKESIPRARKLSSRLRSLASASTNSLRSLSRPSLSSETSVSFDSPTTVSIEPVTPQDTGSGESGKVGSVIGSPGGRSQVSQGSGSEWGSPPRRRDMLGRASSFADRLISRVGKSKSGFLDSSQGSFSSEYLSPMRANTVSNRNPSRESQRGTSNMNEKYGTPTQATSPPRIELPFFGNEDVARTPPNNSTSSNYLSANSRTLPSLPLTPSTPDTSSFFDSTELFDAFPSVPQNLPRGPGSSLLSGFELRTNSDLGLGGGLGKAATIPSSYRPRTSQSHR